MKKILLLLTGLLLLANCVFAREHDSLGLARRTIRAYKSTLKRVKIVDKQVTNVTNRPYFEWEKHPEIATYTYVLTKKEKLSGNVKYYTARGSSIKTAKVLSEGKYNLFIKAQDNKGNDYGPVKVFSFEYDITPPSKLDTVDAIAVPNQKVVLTWNKSDDKDLLGYYIYRSSTMGKGYVKVNSKPASPEGLSYEDLSVIVGNSYYYKIKAVDAAGNESEESIEVSAPYIVVKKDYDISHDWDDGKDPVAGAIITYKISFKNLGFGPADNITLMDVIPRRTTYEKKTVLSNSKAIVQYWDATQNKRYGGWVTKEPKELKNIQRIRWHVKDKVMPLAADEDVSGYVEYQVRINRN